MVYIIGGFQNFWPRFRMGEAANIAQNINDTKLRRLYNVREY
jgi:hypothetical protein